MPDAFLRRVIEQREREQEFAIHAAPPIVLPKSNARICVLCGRGIRAYRREGAPFESSTVCKRCGGREREAHLRAAGTLPQPAAPAEVVMPENLPAAVCSTTGCGRRLRSNNRSGLCPAHKYGAPKNLGDGAETTSAKASAPDVRKQFRTVASALGIDGDALIDAFCRGWLSNLKRNVRLPDPDDVDDYQLPSERSAFPAGDL